MIIFVHQQLAATVNTNTINNVKLMTKENSLTIKNKIKKKAHTATHQYCIIMYVNVFLVDILKLRLVG